VIRFQSPAIKGVCAWPNLTLLPDGSVVALIFNRPSHGGMAGDVECWGSEDEGRTWVRRGVVAAGPDEDSNRMNVAAGLATNGDLLAVVSGWSGISEGFDKILQAVVCRSADGGRTWHQTSELDPVPEPGLRFGGLTVPFGDILPGADGRLRLSHYCGASYTTFVSTSPDDGRTWQSPVKLGENTNETALLHLGEGRWLAAARTNSPADIHLYASEDDTATWADRGPVTEASQHPGHLLRLGDGRILLTYGNRVATELGTQAMLSADEGETWSPPLRLARVTSGDSGYPASIQLPDGAMLTAYYARSAEDCDEYHMGVVVWDLPAR
jgi:hypothetical protein